MDEYDSLDDLFLDIEIDEEIIEPQPEIGEERSLAKRKLTKDEALEEIAKTMGLDFSDFDGENDDPFLTQVALEYKVILGLYMTGRSPTEIARHVSTSTYRVNKVLASPQNLHIINHWKKAVEIELDGLLPLAIDAIRTGLKSGDPKVRLMAVDRYEKLSGAGRDQTGVTVTIVQNARENFIETLKELASNKGIVDAAFKEVDNAPSE